MVGQNAIISIMSVANIHSEILRWSIIVLVRKNHMLNFHFQSTNTHTAPETFGIDAIRSQSLCIRAFFVKHQSLIRRERDAKCDRANKKKLSAFRRQGVRGHYFKRTKSHFKYQFAFFSSRVSRTLSLHWPAHCAQNLASYQKCRARSFSFCLFLPIDCVQRRVRSRVIRLPMICAAAWRFSRSLSLLFLAKNL